MLGEWMVPDIRLGLNRFLWAFKFFSIMVRHLQSTNLVILNQSLPHFEVKLLGYTLKLSFERM